MPIPERANKSWVKVNIDAIDDVHSIDLQLDEVHYKNRKKVPDATSI